MNDTRIAKVRDYLLEVLDNLTTDNTFQLNIDMLSNEIGDYSLDKIPTQTEIEKWITGVEIHRDVFSLRSKKAYSQDFVVNLENIGFFEAFENKIKDNNEKGVLPDIEGIEGIECLNCGALNIADTNEAIFDIQIQITYKVF